MLNQGLLEREVLSLGRRFLEDLIGLRQQLT